MSHFVSGVAAATFIPRVVTLSAEGSFVLLLAGIGGIVPDALDFRLARYLQKPDLEVIPDPGSPDATSTAQQIAASVGQQTADAIETAYRSGIPLRVRYHAAKVDAFRWLEYELGFAGHGCRVAAHVGWQAHSLATSDHTAADDATWRVPLSVPVSALTDTKIEVSALGSATLEFGRRGTAVQVTFLPWHRRWSHSLLIATLVGASIAVLLGPLCGLAYTLGHVLHIVEDQLGHMGSSLLYPLVRRRIGGLRAFHSVDVLPNLFAVWASAMMILFNLDRFSPAPVLDPWAFFGLGLVAPWGLILLLSQLRRRSRPPADASRIAAPAAEREDAGS